MTSGVENILVPSKFVIFMAHVLILLSTHDVSYDNIKTGLPIGIIQDSDVWKEAELG